MSYGVPEINQEHIKCECCGDWYKKITSAHLKKHNLTIPLYKLQFGFDKNQPLEAFYVRDICIEKEREHNGRVNLVDTYKFKKGHDIVRADRQQQMNRLKKYADIQKHSCFVLTPEEIMTVVDLVEKMKYPKEKVARLFRVSEKTITLILQKIHSGVLNIEKQRMR